MQLNTMKNICLNGKNKQVAPLELNTLIVFNATNSRLGRSRRKTNKFRSGNNAVFETICVYLEFYGRSMLLHVPPQRD